MIKPFKGNFCFLLLSGDIEVNPGLVRDVSNVCPSYFQTVVKNHRAVQCMTFAIPGTILSKCERVQDF